MRSTRLDDPPEQRTGISPVGKGSLDPRMGNGIRTPLSRRMDAVVVKRSLSCEKRQL